MSTEKERWAKLAGLPEPTEKQQLDENFVGMGMVGNIFDREKEKYEDAFEHFLSERYEEKEKVEEELTSQQLKQLNLSSLRTSIYRAIQSFENKEKLEKYLSDLVGELEDSDFKKDN